VPPGISFSVTDFARAEQAAEHGPDKHPEEYRKKNRQEAGATENPDAEQFEYWQWLLRP
jgi:hypothetical protein